MTQVDPRFRQMGKGALRRRRRLRAWRLGAGLAVLGLLSGLGWWQFGPQLTAMLQRGGAETMVQVADQFEIAPVVRTDTFTNIAGDPLIIPAPDADGQPREERLVPAPALLTSARRVATPAALVSVSAHKFGGPRGVGALVFRSGTPLRALLPGGGQELGRRSGTTHVAGIVGMAAALSALDRERDEVVRRVSGLRDRLESELGGVPGVVPTVASSTPRLAGTAHLLIDDVDSEPLLFLLDDAGVRASAGSACASGAAAASHVLAAIGADAASDGRRRGALRLTLGHDATDGQVDRAVEVIAATVERLRAPVRRLTPDREG